MYKQIYQDLQREHRYDTYTEESVVHNEKKKGNTLDEENMKQELKSYLKQIKNKGRQNNSQGSSSSRELDTNQNTNELFSYITPG